MNEQDYYEALTNLLSQVDCHENLTDDLLALFAKSGQEARLLAVLVTALQILRIHGQDAIHVKPSQFEKLTHEADLYSMHVHTARMNCRILYMFSHGRPVLLYAFLERQGHRKTDYSGALRFARERTEEWRNQYE